MTNNRLRIIFSVCLSLIRLEEQLVAEINEIRFSININADRSAISILLADQRILRLRVIKLDVLPGFLDVTIATGLTQLTFVVVVFLVATDTVGRRIPEFFIRRMSVGALRVGVRKLQVKIRQFVVEVVFIQIDDVPAPADVLCMTCGAFGPADLSG